MKTREEWEQQLKDEGFGRIDYWQDTPNTLYRNHVHSVHTTHVILRGQMSVKMRGASKTYREGDRIDVPPGRNHSAQVGPAGCSYLTAEK